MTKHSILQSDIESELDLAETRKQMQDELAKIRQTETDMRRELAEMRGSMDKFENSQNQSLDTSYQSNTPQQQNHQPDTSSSSAIEKGDQ